MGIGDRHPSNILVMKKTGYSVHIDFSDCFEKASLRQNVPEVVPFRLTRMLVKALGPSGISGIFRLTAEHVIGLMRCHQDTLLAFLDIFVQDPITDTIWYKRETDGFDRFEEGEPKDATLQRAILRVKEKLNGTEFGGVMNEKEQVATLIDLASSKLQLCRMYYGWAPYW
jgi:phosphatidylinositol kinase/protein kinase (PI-3  family)